MTLAGSDLASVHAIAGLLRDDPSVLFVTGAGVSADSGLPTYRGVGGLYEDTAVDEGVPIEVALSGPMFRRDPALVWKYILQIEQACRGASPNRAHAVIAQLEQRLSRVVVLTQNVDGLHRAAGSRAVIAIHGDVHDLRCTACPHRRSVSDYEGLPVLPTCPDCGAVVRPEVVLFEEMLPPEPLARLEAELARGFDLVFSVGTTSVFPYIAAPVWITNRRGGTTVEINPTGSEVSDSVTYRIRRGAAEALGAIADALEP